jgi:aquaporin related protein
LVHGFTGRREADVVDWINWVGPALGAIIAAGFYKLLKWLQYETVLGPEDGEAPKPADKKGKKDVPALGTAGGDGGPGRMGDEEKNIGNSGTMAVSGPGLGDLHTEAAQDGGVSIWARVPVIGLS